MFPLMLFIVSISPQVLAPGSHETSAMALFTGFATVAPSGTTALAPDGTPGTVFSVPPITGACFTMASAMPATTASRPYFAVPFTLPTRSGRAAGVPMMR